MLVCTCLGLFILLCIAFLTITVLMSFLWGIGDDTGVEDRFLAALVTVILTMLFVESVVFVTFNDNPERFGYTRIETEVTIDE